MAPKPKSTTWKIEPHTLAKHEILRRYLNAWFPIILNSFSHAIYVDGFCGPGKYEGGEKGSPIIALDVATDVLSRISKNCAIDFYFFDEDPQRIAYLESLLATSSYSPNFRIHCRTGKFGDLMQTLLPKLPDAPLFVFVDPFGWSGIPFEIMRSILERRSAELFINIMIDSINRFLEHPDASTQQHFIDLFGSKEILKAAQFPHRIEFLRLFYQKQLKKVATYVKYFQMDNDKNRLIYYLFFASNNQLGYVRMKEAFWKVDPTGTFRFSDATDPNQLILLLDDQTNVLEEKLQTQFNGQEVLVSVIENFIEQETIFLGKHMRKALKNMEKDQRIEVSPVKSNGQNRRKGTFPSDASLRFMW